jgi:hypothetical protein
MKQALDKLRASLALTCMPRRVTGSLFAGAFAPRMSET